MVQEGIAEGDDQILDHRQARVASGIGRLVIEGEIVADVERNGRLRLHLEVVVHHVAQELPHIDGAAEGGDRTEQIAVLGAEVHRAVGAHGYAGDRTELPVRLQRAARRWGRVGAAAAVAAARGEHDHRERKDAQ